MEGAPGESRRRDTEGDRERVKTLEPAKHRLAARPLQGVRYGREPAGLTAANDITSSTLPSA